MCRKVRRMCVHVGYQPGRGIWSFASGHYLRVLRRVWNGAEVSKSFREFTADISPATTSSSLFLPRMETVGASGSLFGILGAFLGDYIQVSVQLCATWALGLAATSRHTEPPHDRRAPRWSRRRRVPVSPGGNYRHWAEHGPTTAGKACMPSHMHEIMR